MTQKKNFDTKFMVELALMIAIIIIMSLTPLGYIRTPGLSITLLTVPVAVGAVLLGPTGGAICGLAFGLTSFYMALTGESAFSSMLLSISPIGTVVTCILPRVLEGWLSGLLFKAMYKGGVSRKFSYFAASLACPLLNTLLFITLFLSSSNGDRPMMKSKNILPGRSAPKNQVKHLTAQFFTLTI